MRCVYAGFPWEGDLYAFINETLFYSTQLAILVVALGVISVRLFPKLHLGGVQPVKTSNSILVGLGALALLNFINFSLVPKPHYNDTFHYYIGSKYFPEIGYTRLYACVVRADAESDDFAVRTKAYYDNIKDLRIGEVTDNIVPARTYYFDDNYCKARFSPVRWDAFKNDVEFFRSRIGNARWMHVKLDNGFNPPPVWTLAGGFLSNLIPLSDSAITGITLIDVTLLFGSVACLAWAFGLPTAAFAVIVGTTSTPYSWDWIGGSMLRLDWFFMAILAVCAMKRGYYVIAGAALGYAASLRLFPAVIALAPFVGLLYAIYKRQYDLKAAYGKFFCGMVFSSIALVAAATAVYGVAADKEFFDNTRRHSAAIATNNVGIRQVLTYSIGEKWLTKNRFTYDEIRDKSKTINEMRAKVMPIYVAVAAIALLLLIPAVMSGGAWQAIALGALFIPFMWSELSNYYYLFLTIVGTLFAVNWKVAFPLLGIGIATKIGLLLGMAPFNSTALFSVAICIAALSVWWQVNSLPHFWRQALSSLATRKT